MKENRGITLVALIIIVVLLLMLSGIIIYSIGDTFDKAQVIQFTSYMKAIQKKVDFYVEDGTDCETLGKALNSENRSRLQNIINKDTGNLIDTNDINSSKIRYFDSADIYKYFDIADIEDEIVVNFENREVISLKGIEKNGYRYYVENGL